MRAPSADLAHRLQSVRTRSAGLTLPASSARRIVFTGSIRMSRVTCARIGTPGRGRIGHVLSSRSPRTWNPVLEVNDGGASHELATGGSPRPASGSHQAVARLPSQRRGSRRAGLPNGAAAIAFGGEQHRGQRPARDAARRGLIAAPCRSNESLQRFPESYQQPRAGRGSSPGARLRLNRTSLFPRRARGRNPLLGARTTGCGSRSARARPPGPLMAQDP